MSNPVCPKCGASRTTRNKRRGFLQRLFYEDLGRYPWRCGECGKHFISHERGEKRKKHRTKTDQTLLPVPRPRPEGAPPPADPETESKLG